MAIARRRPAPRRGLTDEQRRVCRFALQLLTSQERPPSRDERRELCDRLSELDLVMAGYAVVLGAPIEGGGTTDELAIKELRRLLDGGPIDPWET
jgi:hypothetical protein